MLNVCSFLILMFTRQNKARVVSWCNGSTTDFDSVCLGSNPGETTIKASV